MAAGFWAWLCAPAAPQAATVAAPRLHTAAVQVDSAAEHGEDTAEYAEHVQTGATDSAPSEPNTARHVGAGDTPVGSDAPAAAAPRAPPATF
jgi:hypothetical protein